MALWLTRAGRHGEYDLLENLFKTYDQLPESFRAELPLKRTWVMVQED